MTRVDQTDLGILGLKFAADLPPDSPFRKAALSSRVPQPGESLTILGFMASEQLWEAKESEIREVSGRVIVCNGQVTSHYLAGRGRMNPGPIIEVDCPAFGGMSGGPVFDSHGRVVGIVSSSFDDGPAYVSLLWPALVGLFEGGWPEGLVWPQRTRLIDMADVFCSIDRRDCVKRSATGGWEYHAWS